MSNLETLLAEAGPGRAVTDHRLNGLNNNIRILAGKPNSGGASTVYAMGLVSCVDGGPGVDPNVPEPKLRIVFQDGPVDQGYNGFSNEALVAILIDRLKGVQGMLLGQTRESAPFACRENACALTHLEEALMWLQKRTRDRMARGVEGTHQK